eukprot:Amastigsp_a509291_42.p2 type:complete len:362 gc:universal Amastigsp_a509291_42:264-1349(+)
MMRAPGVAQERVGLAVVAAPLKDVQAAVAQSLHLCAHGVVIGGGGCQRVRNRLRALTDAVRKPLCAALARATDRRGNTLGLRGKGCEGTHATVVHAPLDVRVRRDPQAAEEVVERRENDHGYDAGPPRDDGERRRPRARECVGEHKEKQQRDDERFLHDVVERNLYALREELPKSQLARRDLDRVAHVKELGACRPDCFAGPASAACNETPMFHGLARSQTQIRDRKHNADMANARVVRALAIYCRRPQRDKGAKRSRNKSPQNEPGFCGAILSQGSLNREHREPDRRNKRRIAPKEPKVGPPQLLARRREITKRASRVLPQMQRAVDREEHKSLCTTNRPSERHERVQRPRDDVDDRCAP